MLRPAEPPAYTEADLIREMKEDTGFSQLLGETQRRLGKVLSTEELKILLSIYNYLGLPAEVISILISFCMQRAKAKKLRRPPSMRTIEKEAYHWADQGIETLEEAAAYVQLEMEKQTKLRAMQRAVYRPHNAGHYALGAGAYCHFTSPIRRYPDLLVRLTLFHAVIRAGTPQKLEHNDIRWITVDEIDQYAFCPADKEILRRLKDAY